MKENLGRYKIIRELGRGAMGIVYQGYDPKIDRVVALKTIRKDRLAESKDGQDLAARFQDEIRAAGKLVHPNIIIVYDTGEDEEAAYVAMEYVEGDTLENLIQRGMRFSREQVIDILGQICEGLEYTHRRGIVHRDLKPSNIMLVKGKKVKITDFGISKAVGASSSLLTHTGILLGTPSYMSPEQITGKEIDGRSDIFSLGIIFYQLLTGEKPFAGDNISTLLFNIVNKDPAPPSEVDPKVPSIYDEVVAKALAKDPAKRYRRASDFLQDLKKAFRSGEMTEAWSAEATLTAPRGIVDEIYPKRSRLGLLAVLTGLFVVLSLGGYWLLYQRKSGPPVKEGVSKGTLVGRKTPSVDGEQGKPATGEVRRPETVRAVGSIVVRSHPPDAEVFLNGERQEEPTPTVITGVNVGERHEIRVVKKGYKPWSGAVEPKVDESITLDAQLVEKVGTIVVKSKPEDATVFLDGKRISGSTPIELHNISADDAHSLRVAKEGYESGNRTVTVKQDERIEVDVALKPVLGEIRVTSEPPGAEVYLDGEHITGTTPTRISALSLGRRYTLRLKKEGFLEWEGEVRLRDAGPLEIPEVVLKEAYGNLKLLVFPWADVYYKGRKVGTTPLTTISLREGEHRLVLKNPPLNIEREITVRIKADKVATKSVNMTAGLVGKLKIKARPWARVYVDGKDKGMTPLPTLELPAGEHIVQLENEKLGKKRSARVLIRPNEVHSLDVDLLGRE